ncbi:MAG: hypothetical protein AAF737_08265, partial [Pseudomonadota bacterium]
MATLNLGADQIAQLGTLAASGDAMGYYGVLAEAGDGFSTMLVDQLTDGSAGNGLLTGFSGGSADMSALVAQDFALRSTSGFSGQTSHALANDVMDAGMGAGKWYLDLPLATAADAQSTFERSVEVY